MPRIGLGRVAPLIVCAAGLAALPSAAPAQEPWYASQQHGDEARGFGTPQVAMGARGDVVLTWPRSDTSAMNGRIEAVSRLPGGGWGEPETLGTSDDEGSPDVDVAADGGAGVAFVESFAAPRRIRVALRSPGGDWGPAEIVAAGEVESPRFGIGDDGRAAVGWIDRPCDSCGHRIVVSVREGGAWSTPEPVVEGLDDHRQWDLAVAGDGGVVVVAERPLGGGQWEVAGATRPPGGPWSDDDQIGPYSLTDLGSHLPLVLDMNDAGDAVVGSTGEDRAWIARRPAGGSFGAPDFLAPASSMVVDVSAGPAGDVAAATYAWDDDDNRATQVTSGPVGGALSAPETLAGPVANVSSLNLEHLAGTELAIVGQRETGRTIAGGIREEGGSFYSIDGPPTDLVAGVRADGDGAGNLAVLWTRLWYDEPSATYRYTANSALGDFVPRPAEPVADPPPAEEETAPPPVTGGSPPPTVLPPVARPRVTRSGRVRLRLRGGLVASRNGIIRLRLRFDRRAVGRVRLVDSAGRTLGRARFSARAGDPKVVRIALTRRALRRLRGGRRLRVRVRGRVDTAGLTLPVVGATTLRLARG